ncbi:SIR2 family protein [Aeromonas hydrophila]|uniref:SIR2 family protein n=3 Tax=Aeromonas hydrophila TaxID=644 RepID=UPI00039FA1EF|nr:SIR2 family protein [Aeromonas hydrophila]EGX6959199.1 hypothetical protein [Aeromonas hydrophila]MBC6398519.1 hypothetical protein [Aeromonas hydrophila]MCA4699883.1 SIR2 family protein [Aeromonas hydrophila]MCO4223038.1 SIR2 family protein [Aeromonas hydrophila]ORJ65314.1 hypothetical protein B5717_20500 [Aeromonas hydrophila]
MEAINRENIKTIRRAIDNNKLVIFVGSAVSYDSKLPTWKKLIDSMKAALDKPRTDDYLKIAEHYHLQYGRNTYYNKINEFFPKESIPNKLHDLIISLRPQHIVTTNWDDLLEKTIHTKNELYFKVANDHELASSPSSKLLIKMHGDLSLRNIVFKESDYHAYSDNFPLIENFIKSLFSTHVVLFIGYSISDYNLNQILTWVRNRTTDAPPAFTLLTESSLSLSEDNYLKEKGIYPLLNDNTSNTLSYYDLSRKSSGVARVLEEIANPSTTVAICDILSEASSYTSDWNNIYPTNLIRLLRDKLDSTELNKIYYDASNDSIEYKVDDDVHYSRSDIREIRKSIIKILKTVSVSEVRLHIDRRNRKFYRIRNPHEINFIDEYTTFDFMKISQRSSSINFNLSLDETYDLAFDYYFLKKLELSRDTFSHLANLFFSKSYFVKSLLASYNKKHLCFGEIPLESVMSFYDISMGEQLSKNDNISEMIDRFPKQALYQQKALLNGLDANNSFILERFKTISHKSRELDDEIHQINNGSMIFSNKYIALYNYSYCTVLFVIKNKLSILYSSDFKYIARTTFEFISKRMVLDNRTFVDKFLSYAAIISFNRNELSDFLSSLLKDKQSLDADNDTTDYLLTILKNCIHAIKISDNSSIIDYSIRVWHNTLALLSFISHENDMMSKITSILSEIFETTRWTELTDSTNKFLVFQINKYEFNFTPETLEAILNKQIDKLSNLDWHPLREDGLLFSNLLYILNEKNQVNEIISKNKKLYAFINNIMTYDIFSRLAIIERFVFSIYTLSSGQLHENVANLLKTTYIELKGMTIDEKTITYGLNLILAKVHDYDELDYIMEQLKTLAQININKGSFSTHYSFIKKQLSSIEMEHLNKYRDIVEMVNKLSDQIESDPFLSRKKTTTE